MVIESFAGYYSLGLYLWSLSVFFPLTFTEFFISSLKASINFIKLLLRLFRPPSSVLGNSGLADVGLISSGAILLFVLLLLYYYTAV